MERVGLTMTYELRLLKSIFSCFIPEPLPHLGTLLSFVSCGMGSLLRNLVPLLAKHGECLATAHRSI